MKEKKYILFDLDGTLTDPKEGITKAVQYSLAHYGIEETDLDVLCPFIGRAFKGQLHQFLRFFPGKSHRGYFCVP